MIVRLPRPTRLIFPVVVAAIMVFLVSPLVVLIGTAFTTTSYLTFPPKGWTLSWFVQVLQDPTWGRAALNSLVIAAAGALLASLVAVPAAVVLARRGVRASNAMTTLIMAPIMVPGIMFVLGVMLSYNRLDMATPQWGLVLALAVLTAPYIARTMIAALSQLDPALEEAAMSLGASRVRAWIQIVIPNVAKSYFSGLALAFILAFDELVVPLFLAGPSFPTLPVRIYRSVAYDVNPEISAVSTLLVVVAVVVATFAVRDPSTAKNAS